MSAGSDIKIAIRDLTMAYGSFVVMRDINAQVKRGEVFVIMGGSGCGKSTLLRHMIGLKEPDKGEIYYDGTPFWTSDEEVRTRTLRSFGVLFQSGALWSSMTLAENIGLVLGEYTDFSAAEIREIARLKLALVGLKGFEDYYPAEISGGMCKRAERLDSGFQRVLAANLAILLPTDRIALSAWQRNEVMAEVYVTLEQFDVDASGRGVLVARWRSLSPEGDRVLKTGTSRLSRLGPPPDCGVSGAICTLSALVADFAVQLAQALKEATSPPQATPLSKRQEQGGGPPAQVATREVGNHERFEPFVSCSAPVTQMFSEVPEFPVHDYRARYDFERVMESNSEAPHRIPHNINT